jgi:Family of unknown function (DUF6653)
MDFLKLSERAMGMDEASWQRHANPWSVLSRFSILPLLCLAVWSRAWLGPGAWLPVALVLVWTWFNPRLFAPPRYTRHWASRVTFGERVYLNRAQVPVPAHYRRWTIGLGALAGLGLVPMAVGLWRYDPGLTVAGLVLSMGAKAWLCDRMAFLYDEMIDKDPVCRGWMRPPADG